VNKKIPLCVLFGLAVSLVANAGEAESGTAQGVFVDVAKVVAAGAVSPVDGPGMWPSSICGVPKRIAA